MTRQLKMCIIVAAALCAACAPGGAASTTTTTTTTTEVPPGDGDALISLSIHVEGWTLEDDSEAQFDVHVGHLLDLATTAHDVGAVLTFELSPDFTRAVTRWDSDVLDTLTGLGHEIAIHADVGGLGTPSLGQMTAELESQIDLLEATGYSTNHVSGICSRGPWVEAAVAAGFTSVAGGVEYCLTSLLPEHVPEGYEWVSGCANPAVCHGPVPVPADQAAFGWWASSSDDWIVDASEGDLLILTGPFEGQLSCFQWSDPGPCPDQADNLATIESMVDEYVELAQTTGATTVLPLTDSVGGVPAEGFPEALFATIDTYVDAGVLQWSGLPSAAAGLGA
jgi:hypothetical protein